MKNGEILNRIMDLAFDLEDQIIEKLTATECAYMISDILTIKASLDRKLEDLKVQIHFSNPPKKTNQ